MDGKVGKIIREKRHAHGVSVVKLADRAGVSASYIYALENGDRKGSRLDKLGRIAKVLQLNLCELAITLVEKEGPAAR